MKHVLRPLLVMVIALPAAHANDPLLDGLFASQTQSSSGGVGTSSGSQVEEPEVPEITSSASSNQNCESSGQTTIPLRYVMGLLRSRGATLQVTQDAAAQRMHVRGGQMLANCNSMLEWGLRSPSAQFPQYVVELKIKPCGSASCSYSAMEINAQGQQVSKQVTVEPNFEGFKQCLRQTGVLSDTGVNSSKVISRDLDVTFGNVTATGPVWFGSHLPAASAVYEKKGERGCYYMEDIREGGQMVYSPEDSERVRLDEQAQLVCEAGNYRNIADFIERYGQYNETMGSIRDELIIRDYQALAEIIRADQNLATQDYSVITDFQRYVVDPLTTRITALHEEISRMPQNQARRLKEQELQELLRQLASYRQAPFLTASDMDKLMARGLFDEAAQVQGIHLTAQHYGRIGATDSGTLVTARLARERVQAAQGEFRDSLVERRQEYEVRTGRVTGQGDYYLGLAQRHRRNIQTRTQNYEAEIQAELQRIQQGGYCYQYFRNTQRCVADATQRIRELQAQLQRYNESDAAIAGELEERANQFSGWEEEGRRYIAAQEARGEVVESRSAAQTSRPAAPEGPSVEAPRSAAVETQLPTQSQGALPGQQMQNPWLPLLQQMQNPYAQQQQMGYNPYMQQQQMGYNPYAGLGQSSFSQPYFGFPQQRQQFMGYNPMMQGMQSPYTFNFGGASQQYGGNIWAGQQNPYMMQQGQNPFMQQQYGMMQNPWMMRAF